jgi:hypothetical protein
MSTTFSDPATMAIEDRLAILDLTARLALTVDAKDWDGFEGLFADPQTQTPAELAAGLKGALGNLDTTHHLIACQTISLDGDLATSSANMVGRHVYANASGGSAWTVGGRHDYEFKRTAQGWRIAGITFNLQWAEGNEQILTLAATGQRR